MTKLSITSKLKVKKNLLAFSAGGDSTALFFLLLENGVSFDIAIVDYGIRQQSKEEVSYAKELAKTYNLKCYIHQASHITNNFEKNAREIRYDFFTKIIKTNSYETLLTAHHLGDRFEWMLMQFCKGAGCVEMAGMKQEEKRDFFTLFRPLLQLDKSELLEYLNLKNIKYFEDETNQDESIKRNFFRHNYTKELLEKHLNGIKKSFSYIDEDRAILIPDVEVSHIGLLSYFKNQNSPRVNIFYIDKILKEKGYMVSQKEREILKSQKTFVVGRKFVVNQDKNYIFIIPYLDAKAIPKEFKEICRELKIEPKLRYFFYENQDVLRDLQFNSIYI